MTGRLALLTPTLSGGGAERMTARLATGCAAQGQAVDLVVATRDAVQAYRPEVSSDVRIVPLGAARAATCLPLLVRYLRRVRPAALVTALDYVNVVGLVAARLAGTETRVVVAEHNTPSAQARGRSGARERLVGPLARLLYPRADAIAAVSEGVAADLADRYAIPRARITVVANPVVSPGLADLASAPCPHPWLAAGHDVPVLVAVGRMTAQKDFPTLLDAFTALRRNGRAARLLLLGDGPDRAALTATVRRADLDVDMPGWVDNVYAYLSRADGFVLSSRWEGLPTVLIEALYCGVPVIATDCPSGPREILANGRFGRLVRVGDAGELATALADACSGRIPPADPASWRRYDRDRVAERYLALAFGG